MNNTKLLLLISFILLRSLDAYAHDGKLDSGGCHPNGEIGGYHCHDSEKTEPKNSKNISRFFGIEGREYFQVSASAIKVFAIDVDNDPAINSNISGDTVDLSSDMGYGFSSKIGFDFNNPFRTELEYSFWHASLSDIDGVPEKEFDPVTAPVSGYIRAHSLSLNGYYVYKPAGGMHSYLGAGVGITGIKAQVEKNTTNTAVSPHIQGMFGLEYEIDEIKKLVLGYKISAIMQPDLEIFEEGLVSNSLEIGVIFYF